MCADHGAAALEKNIALELDAPASVEIEGNADMLRVLLRNLLDNALRYAPPGGAVGYVLDRTLLGVAARGTGRWLLGRVAAALR